MSSPDPWELRERQKRKWQQSTGPRSRSDKAGTPSSPLFDGGLNLRANYLSVGLLLAVVLLLAASVPFTDLPPQTADVCRTVLIQTGSVLLVLLVAASGGFGQPLRSVLGRTPHPFLLILLCWAGAAYAWAPYRGYATTELTRVFDSAAVYFLAAYALRHGKKAAFFVTSLLGLGCVLGIAQMAEIGQIPGGAGAGIQMSRLGAHGNLGSVILLFAVPALALALESGLEEKRRLAALAAALVLFCALLLERARSSWIGAGAALLVLALAWWLTRRGGGESTSGVPIAPKRRRGPLAGMAGVVFSPVFLAVFALVAAVVLGGVASQLTGRAATFRGGAAFTQSTFQSRVVTWNGAARMAMEKPLTGWGLGAFSVMQGRWTHTGDETVAALAGGTSNFNLAHNFYLQWAADTGLPGLFLYTAFLVALVASLLVGLSRTGHHLPPFERALLAGACAVTVGTSVDALASPSHHFHGVSSLMWVWMGLGVAALSRAAEAKNTAEEIPRRSPFSLGIAAGAVFAGVAAAGIVAGMVQHVRAEGLHTPPGTLEVVAGGRGPYRGGSTLVWTARYHEKGISYPTLPGTQWEVIGDPRLVRASKTELYIQPLDPMDLENRNRRAQIRVFVPMEAARAARPADGLLPFVAVKATYFDLYGRKYQATSVIRLEVN